MGEQLRHVMDYAELREDRLAEILSQAPQLASYWCSVAALHPERTPRTLELLDMAVRLAIRVEMRFKHALAFPRPVEFSSQVQPCILTPSHSSYPSGHSTEAFCSATLLSLLRGDPILTEMLHRQATRIAVNRTVAGVHFPMDSRAGQVLGTTLAEYLVACCTSQQTVTERRFDANDYLDHDFFGSALDPNAPEPEARAGLAIRPGQTLPTRLLLNWLWTQARNEWK